MDKFSQHAILQFTLTILQTTATFPSTHTKHNRAPGILQVSIKVICRHSRMPCIPQNNTAVHRVTVPKPLRLGPDTGTYSLPFPQPIAAYCDGCRLKYWRVHHSVSGTHQARRLSSLPRMTWSPLGWMAMQEITPLPPTSFLARACECQPSKVFRAKPTQHAQL